MARTIEGFSWFSVLPRRREGKRLIYGMGAWRMGDIKPSEAMKRASEMEKSV